MAVQSTIYFYGGAGTVTGSNFLLDTGGAKFLIDCGLFQGAHAFDDENWKPFPFDPARITHLINTHAHIDHIGRIPKLVRDGYRGRILSTEATKSLAEPMLLDAMELSRKTAMKIGKEPLYDEDDITQALSQWDTVPYHKVVELSDGVTVEFLNSGHILGSAMALLRRGSAGQAKSILFTGDLGGGNSPLLATCEVPKDIDYVVMESVYGDRIQTNKSQDIRLEQLAARIKEVAQSGGTLLIPAFSTERTQDLLYDIRSLMMDKKIPSMPVFLDSPLAQKITASYLSHPHYFSEAIQARIKAGEKLFEFPELQYVHDAQESRNIGARSGPKIIIAGSGMSNGGRVVQHELDVLSDERSTILIVGYQAAGSLGRKLADGFKKVPIKGTHVPVRCHVETLYSYSAHMDGSQLLEFVEQIGSSLTQVFVTMGEPASSTFLAQRIREYVGVRARAPGAGTSAKLEL